jgi:Icc-related predicted phosphoesterase
MKIARMLTVLVVAAVLAAAGTPALAEGDTVHFGSNINVAPDAEISDAVCIFCNVHVQGKVTGDVVAVFGNVDLAGDAQHDVVDIFGEINAESNSSVEQDLVSVFGSVHLGENVAIGQDLVALFGTLHEAATVTVGNDTVVKPGWIVWGPFLLILLVVILIVREHRAYRRRLVLRGYQFPPKS